MKVLTAVVFGTAMFTIVGCGGSGFDPVRYKQAVEDGFKKIPQACEIECLVGEADHFISYSGPDVGQDWNTEVYFGGRYCLTMQVDVKVNKDFSRITEVIGEPKFYLSEFTKVDLNADGRTSGSTEGGESATFGVREWNQILKSGGDFSVVAVHIKKNQPVPNFDKFVEAVRRPRIQIHPDCNCASKSREHEKWTSKAPVKAGKE